MLLIKAEVRVATDPRMGLGLFTLEFIPANSVIWEFVEGLDLKISPEKFEILNSAQKAYFYKYGWVESKEDKYFYASCDLTNFMNHSYSPNIESRDTDSFAIRDIQIGEELFIDYSKFSLDFDKNDFWV